MEGTELMSDDQTRPAEAEEGPRSPLTVVVIDDEQQQAWGLTARLRDQGVASVLPHLSPQQALTLDWYRSPVDVVILDAYGRKPDAATGDHFFAAGVTRAARATRPVGAIALDPDRARQSPDAVLAGQSGRPLAVMVLSHYYDSPELGHRLWTAGADALLPRADYQEDPAKLVELATTPWTCLKASTYTGSAEDLATLGSLGLRADADTNALVDFAVDPGDEDLKALLQRNQLPRISKESQLYRRWLSELRPQAERLGLGRPPWQNGGDHAFFPNMKYVLDRLKGQALSEHARRQPELPKTTGEADALVRRQRNPRP